MHFIKLTQEGGSDTCINMELVCEILPLPVCATREKEGALILFQCTGEGGAQASTKVTQSTEEILAMC